MTFRRVLGFVAMLACLALPAHAAQALPPWTDAATAVVDAAAADVMDRQHVRGMSVTVARDGVVVFSKGYGLRDVGAKLPVTPQTSFPIGSITKTFTATAIGALAQAGKLRYGDRVATILPSVPHAADVTIDDLLHHTSGLPNFTEEPGFITLAQSERPSFALLVALLGGQPLLFAPGTRYAYSNTNYLYLGAIVEKLSGMPFEAFVRERIATPAGAARISYGVPEAGDVALPYDSVLDTPSKRWSTESLRAAGALAATPLDLVRFDTAFFSGRIVAPETVKTLTTPPLLPAPERTNYAGGWVIDALDGHPMIWNNGGVPGANTRNAYFPNEHVAIVVFMNRLFGDETPVLRAVWRSLYPPTAAQIAAQRSADDLPDAPEDPAVTQRAQAELAAWRDGAIDRSHYDASVMAIATDQTKAAVAASITALGTPLRWRFAHRLITNEATIYQYRVTGPGGAMNYRIGFSPAGRIVHIVFQ